MEKNFSQPTQPGEIFLRLSAIRGVLALPQKRTTPLRIPVSCGVVGYEKTEKEIEIEIERDRASGQRH